MKIGVIDIGTNTVLLLIAKFDARGTIKTMRDEQRIIRLGEGVDAAGIITSSAVNRLNACLHDMIRDARDADEVDHLVAFGTSALRRAANANDILQAVKEENGIDIEIISGAEESHWTFVGATYGLSLAQDSLVTVLDIGGGSTEVAIGRADGLKYGRSLDIGVVQMRERFFRSLPPLPNERAAALASVQKSFRPLRKLPFWSRKPVLIAVAGTPTTLACLAKGLDAYDAARIDGAVLSRETIRGLNAKLFTYSLEQLRDLPSVDELRADVLPAGALLLNSFMEEFGFLSLIVSVRGVRYGVAIREWDAALNRHAPAR